MKWRVSVIFLFTCLLSFLSIGAVKEFGNDIKYPAQAAFSLRNSTNDLDKQQVFAKIEDLAKNEKIKIYRPFLDTSGQEKTFLFGAIGEDPIYVTDLSILMKNDVSGMYYVSKAVPESFGKELEQFGLIYQAGDLPWYLTPVYFLFTNLRSLAVWTLFFVFALILLAVKLMYAKKAMIYRSLGLFDKLSTNDFLLDGSFVLLSLAVAVVAFSLYQGSISNVFVKSFVLLMGINTAILLVITTIIHLLFSWNIRLMRPHAILKNKPATAFIVTVWLVGIGASSFIFATTLHHSFGTLSQSARDIEVLGKWDSAKDFASITWFDSASSHIDENNQIDSTFLQENSEQFKRFIQSFKTEDMLYSKPSLFAGERLQYVPQMVKEELVRLGINEEVASAIRYVNENVILKNKKLYPQNQYADHHKNAVGIIYVPHAFMGQLESILALIDFEWFQYSDIKAKDFAIQEVPDRQTNFLFNDKGTEKELFAQQEKSDAILVELHFDRFNDTSLLHRFSAIASDALFKQEKIQNVVEQSEITDFSSMTNVSEKLLLERNKIVSQLTGSLVALVILFLAQCFIIYEYVVIIMKRQAKKVAIYNMLAVHPVFLMIRCFVPLLLCLTLSMVAVRIVTNLTPLALGLSAIYGVVALVIILLSYRSIMKKRIQIIKGDFEII
ncbi:ABC transporter permease [Streptococcus marmotae]|uniref:ABC transporter permease n=1 Tax=Streptococcus marmotae TaxID=1825069 RepID=UPI000834C100|nr:ABC transporter permease [Streptococcus marmotae]